MPSLNPPRLAPLASLVGATGPLKGVDAALRAQDSHAQDIARYVNKALVLGDTVQVWNPYGVTTGLSPLVVPSFWTAATLQNAWANTGGGQPPAQYGIDASGTVFLEGNVGAGAGGTTILTLPSGYRPAKPLQFAVPANNLFGLLDVNANGTVVLSVGAAPFVRLECCFKADATNSAPIAPSCFPFDLLWPFNYAPTVVLAQAQDCTNAASPSNVALGVPDWVMVTAGGQRLVRIRNIPGLLPSTSYAVQVVGW